MTRDRIVALRRLLVLTAVVGLAAGLAVPAFGGAAAAHETDDADRTISATELEGEVLFGQTVAVDDLTPHEDDQTVALRRVDGDDNTLVRYYEIGDDNDVVVDTSNVQDGQYVIRDAEGDHGPFEVAQQQTEFEFEYPARQSGTANGLVWEDDNRAETVDLLVDSSGALDATVLQHAVGGDEFETSIWDDDAIRIRNVTEGDEVPVRTGALEADTYNLTVTVADTGAGDLATFTVFEPNAPQYPASQLDGQVLFGQKMTATELTATDDGTVQLRRGDADDSTHVRTYGLGDGTDLTIDTGELEDDNYVLRDADGDHGPFEVLPQETEFAFANDSVENGATTELVFEDDNRAETVDVRIRASGLSGNELADVFAAEDPSRTVFGNVVIVENVVEGDRLEADFDGVDAGDYTVTVEVEDSEATDDAAVTVEPPTDPDATFDRDTVTEAVGDPVEFEIETAREPESVWLSMTDDRGVYDVTVQLTELDHSESIAVTWNSHEARDEDANAGFSADGATVANVTAEGEAFDSDGHLPNLESGWTFDLEAFVSEEDAEEGDFTDDASIDLEQRQTGELRTYTAPGVNALEHDDDIRDVFDDATERETVADGDLLVTYIDVSGVFGSLETDPSEFASDGLQFELVGPTGAFGSQPVVPIADLEESATISEIPGAAIFVVIDTSEIPEIEDGEQWDARFSIDGAENPYVDDESEGEPEEVASDSFTYEDREIEIVGDYAGDYLLLPSEENAEITAETNVAPGTAVDLEIASQQLIHAAESEVDEDGTVSANVDASAVETGTQLGIRVRAPDNRTEHTVLGVVGVQDSSNVLIDVDAPGESVFAPADPLRVGDDGALDVRLTNAGGIAANTTVEVGMDGDTVLEESVGLDAGAEWSESVQVDTSEAGSVEWAVSTETESSTGSIRVGTDDEFHGYQPLPVQGSDLHYDVNGDGDVSNGDVTTFFSHQHTPTWDERPDLFDFDGNGDVGQGDVIELFEIVNGDSSIGN